MSTIKQKIRIGEPMVLKNDVPDGSRGVVFEDDGQTGYFYARDCDISEEVSVDALHIYTVERVTDRDVPSEIRIMWSSDFTKAALIINDYPHAVFDFHSKCGYSRDQYPNPDPKTGWKHKPWHDSLSDWFFERTDNFYREVAECREVWTIRDAKGFPAPKNKHGIRVQPFWSSQSRVEQVIRIAPAYKGFEPYRIDWEGFRDRWLVGLKKDGLLVGVNWSGRSATGYDVDPNEVSSAIETHIANRNAEQKNGGDA